MRRHSLWILFGLLTLHTSGCLGPFVPVYPIEEAERLEARAAVREYPTSSDLPGRPEFLGSLEGNSCKNLFTDPPASRSDAIDQLKFQVRELRGNALVNVRCSQLQGTSTATNCWQLITCYGDAVRVAERPVAGSASEGVRTGTCFAASPNGEVLTSYHIVESARLISVVFSNGEEAPATLATFSEASDIAVLRTNLSTPAYLTLAARSDAKLGDTVFTIGFPAQSVLGTAPKYAGGSVSALAGPNGDATFIQISIPVNPGNSGSAVVNERGHVVGIVAATAAIEPFYAATGTFPQNISWATRANVAAALFDAPPRAEPVSRATALSIAERASCRVIAEPW